MTPEQRSERSRKGWVTRRATFLIGGVEYVSSPPFAGLRWAQGKKRAEQAAREIRTTLAAAVLYSPDCASAS
jgi:hypothetical protein